MPKIPDLPIGTQALRKWISRRTPYQFRRRRGQYHQLILTTFTVEAFKEIINRARNGVEWVGYQASVFKRANKVSAWLSSLSTDAMASSVRQICERSFEVRDHIDGRAVTTTSLQNLPELLDPAVADFFADPWFSSLLALQETIMRGRMPSHSHNSQNLSYLYQLPHGQRAKTKNDIYRIQEQIMEAGFYYLYSTKPHFPARRFFTRWIRCHQYLVYHPPAVHCATCSKDLEKPKTVLNASSKKVQKKDEKKDNNQDNTIVRGEMLLHSSLGHHP
uniref:Uncharacterized protein n=1 Tax=Coccidioides posadasii RMSCC 3488 TaxID=454284 RepID=A0A0J6FAT7_COCPO|nr:hypothetical protein CPAG_02709 [Coccidioides posadasii RMSCC 3488]